MHKSVNTNCIQSEALQPGMVIVQVTKQNGPIKIRKSGLVTSIEMVHGLIEMGVQEVEIDPAQTVEIDLPVAHKSSTLQLLQTNAGFKQGGDAQLHDQFKRSLFLPSVQDIPSLWQFYLQRYGLLSLVIVVGFGLGFAVAYLPNIIELRNPLVVTELDKTKSTVNVQTTEQSQQDSELNAATKNTQLGAETSDTLKQQGADAAVSEQPNTEITPIHTSSPSVKKSDLKRPKEALEEPLESAADSQTTIDEGEALSPELLKRFEQVMKQMDRERGRQNLPSENPLATDKAEERAQILTVEPEEATSNRNQESIVQDVPRIDQLPAWVMTELPGMSFSAHMYASNPEDRWVKVNGERKMEGDVIDNKVRIINITPQHVILSCKDHEFSMRAMSDW